MKETDLFPPVKILLESLGFNVYAEARNCDVVGRKKEELVIVELKKNLTLTLLSQGMQRQKLTHQVFLCVPQPRKKNSSTRSKEELIKRLGLGLITVYESPVRSAAKIMFEPSTENRINVRERKKLIAELDNRSVNLNIGGSHRVPIYTAYKETSIVVANLLKKAGPTKLKNIRRFAGEKTDNILSKNVYGWFKRVKRGEYEIGEMGLKELKKFKEINTLLCNREDFRVFCDYLKHENTK